MLLKVESESGESESGTEIADSGFLIIYEKPADSGFGLPSLFITQYIVVRLGFLEN